MNKKKKILIVLGIMVVSLSIIGISYAFFSANIIGKGTENVIQAGTMELTFAEDNVVNIETGKPGSKDSKTFSVENTSTLDNDFKYNIKLTGVSTTFVKRDLKYTLEEYPDNKFNTLKEGGIKEEGYINEDSVQEGDIYLATNITRPEKGKKHYYKLTIEFQELNIPQDYNQEAIFSGKINVDDKEGMEIYKQAPNAPELYQGMIPIYFKEGKIYIADASKDNWYNYDNNEWANAVLIDNTNETIKNKFYTDGKLNVNAEVTTEDILQMYVWIPRYRYKLFNTDNQGVEKQIIDIEFEKETETTGNVSCTYTDMKNGTIKEDCKNAENGNWYTHPAFTFGNTELQGIWVGKFEPSDPTDPNGRKNNEISEITILPDKTSMVSKSVKTIFNAEREIELQKATKYNLNATEIDTHMMKNIEWGAVAYLTQSVYGIYKDESTCNIEGMTKDNCEVWINNTAQGAGTTGVTNTYGGTYTGCVGTSVSAAVEWNKDDGSVAKCKTENRWNEKGVKASTTGNMYGVYDMYGGAWEYVMGAIVNQTGGGLYIASSGFQAAALPEAKYYDMYTFSDKNTTHERGHLGDSTRETLLTFGNTVGGWNADYAYFPSRVASGAVYPWFRRGSIYVDASHAGVFAFHWYNGGTYVDCSFRSVLTRQDGNN